MLFWAELYTDKQNGKKMKKTIFITGASTGIGKETAKLFQSKGWNVIATMRTPGNDTELSKLDYVLVIKLDVMARSNPFQGRTSFVSSTPM